ncbi:8361_t:CDS:2 [Paraglomus occultum]|uniref:8361_t:CDS:1 n=1 Tax=Paraglomus occultum TaxID=144539 RepID=A0A9N9FPV9_9GLOM|nr:8361_t:CDS:2 [Paraglomus occultum]
MFDYLPSYVNQNQITHLLAARSVTPCSRHQFARAVNGNSYLATRFTDKPPNKYESLTGHTGCVNTVVWNEAGDLILSGSDDCKLNIWTPFTHPSRSLRHSIVSGHTANIFSARFMANTGDRHIVSCAADGIIRFTDLNKVTDSGIGCPSPPFRCHKDLVRRDRTRRRPFTGLFTYGSAVTAISIRPDNPVYLAAACSDETVRIYDRRFVRPPSDNAYHREGQVYQFIPSHLKSRHRRESANGTGRLRPSAIHSHPHKMTSLKFDPNGNGDLCASYSREKVYLIRPHGGKFDKVVSKRNGGIRVLNKRKGKGIVHGVPENRSALGGGANDMEVDLNDIRLDISDSDGDEDGGVFASSIKKNVDNFMSEDDDTVSTLSPSPLHNVTASPAHDRLADTNVKIKYTASSSYSFSTEVDTNIDETVSTTELSDLLLPKSSSAMSPSLIDDFYSSTTQSPSFSFSSAPNPMLDRLPTSPTPHSSVQTPPSAAGSSVGSSNTTTPNISRLDTSNSDEFWSEIIKEANFFGGRSEYVMSGSDDGRIFVWEKLTGKLVNLMMGDRRVVNCIQPHPFYPILATSGIDYDVKLWYPTADSPYDVSEAEDIVKRNRDLSRESASPFLGERVTVPVPANMFFHFLSMLNDSFDPFFDSVDSD